MMPKFFIGCFEQPVESFAKWKAEGVNICIQPAQSNANTAPARRKAAADLGLFYIDLPESIQDVEAMVADPFCYALCLPDEPSEHEPWYTTPEAAAYVSSFLAKWKPIFDAVKGRKTIWANFGGNRIISGRPWYEGQMVIPYVQGCSVTELSFDSYPINGGNWEKFNAQTTNDYNGGKDPLLIPGETEQQFTYRVLQHFCPPLPVWAYLETTLISLPAQGRCPTGAEIQFEADSLYKLGIKGLVYFTHCMGQGLPWDPAAPAGKTAWDGRGPEQVAACKAIAARFNMQTPPDLETRVANLELIMANLKSAFP